MPGSDVWLTIARTLSLARYHGGTLTICIELMHANVPRQGANAQLLFRIVLNLSVGDITLSNEVKTPGCKSASIPDVASSIKHFIGAHRLLMQANFPTPDISLTKSPSYLRPPPSCSFSLSWEEKFFPPSPEISLSSEIFLALLCPLIIL